MQTLIRDIDRVVDESSRRLLKVAPPPVRYWLLWDVLQRTPGDGQLQATIEECRRYPPRLKLIEELREDGTWPIPRARKMVEDEGPGPPYGWTYVTMLRNLDALGESMTTKDEGRVMASVERILSWQTEDGYIPGPTGPFPLPHYNGYALRNLIVLGMGSDERVRKLESWLLRTQRRDGGWVMPYVQDVKYLPQYKHMRMKAFSRLVEQGQVPYEDDGRLDDIPSCIWTTMMVVRGLTARPDPTSDRRVKRGAEFFLDRFFKENHHQNFYNDRSYWTKLRYPTYFGSGLCALDILTSMGFGPDDERMEKPIRWLLGARSKDGFWSQSDRPHPQKDLWITEVALSILARYSRMR